MATGAFYTAGAATGLTEAATFIPEIWSDEVKADYEKKLVAANTVRRINHTGKKGDTIHVPAPSRGAAYQKAENVAVTLQNNVEGTVDILIDQHWEYSKIIEDIVSVQALDSLRRFYTQDAGYQLAKKVDSLVLERGKYLGNDGGTGSDWVHSNSFYVDATTGLTAYAVDTVTTSDIVDEDGIVSAVYELDNNDIPMDDRVWIIPPSVKKNLMQITAYTSADFISGRPVQNGVIGNLYGMDVLMTTNCPEVETATANTAGDRLIASIMWHRDAVVLATQMDVRSQTQYKQEYLGDLFTADTLFGVHEYQQEAGLVIVVND